MDTPMEILSRATRAMEDKNYEAALIEFVQMYENPDVDIPMHQTIRRSYGFFGWANLATIYPPAMDRLQQEVEAMRSRIQRKGATLQLETDLKALEKALAFVETYD